MRKRNKELSRQHQQHWRDNNKVVHQERQKLNRARLKKLVDDIKLSQGCSICGYKKNPTALHYHHREPDEKEHEISWMVRKGRAFSAIQKEMNKCDLVCANCHHEITYPYKGHEHDGSASV